MKKGIFLILSRFPVSVIEKPFQIHKSLSWKIYRKHPTSCRTNIRFYTSLCACGAMLDHFQLRKLAMCKYSKFS